MCAGSGPTSSSTPNRESPQNSRCNADLDLPNTGLHAEIPTLRCVMPTREQRELPRDIQVMRTVQSTRTAASESMRR
jgi:hypothetical protein